MTGGLGKSPETLQGANFVYMQHDNYEVCSGDIKGHASKSCKGVSSIWLFNIGNMLSYKR